MVSDKTIDRVVTVLTTLVLLALVCAVSTAIYWVAGGEFKRGSDFATYCMVQVYLSTLVLKVALEKHKARMTKYVDPIRAALNAVTKARDESKN